MLFTGAARRPLYLCLAALPILAQFESIGHCTRQRPRSAAPSISKASVTLTNVRTGTSVETSTDANGNYEFGNQRVGTYRVKVAQAGFQTSETQPFELAVNTRQRVDSTLPVGQAAGSVTAKGAVTLTETDTSSRGQAINPREIVEMPLNGRAYAGLMLLAPGVAKSPLENSSTSSRDASAPPISSTVNCGSSCAIRRSTPWASSSLGGGTLPFKSESIRRGDRRCHPQRHDLLLRRL